MTGLHIRQCPRCELRFTSSSELEDHLSNDHRPLPRADLPPAAVAARAPAQPKPRPAPSDNLATQARSRLAGWVVAVAGLTIMILTALFASTLTALITVVLMLAAFYGWRARGRGRSPLRR
jgi:hypothetical protein